jgi:hypothetical protein
LYKKFKNVLQGKESLDSNVDLSESLLRIARYSILMNKSYKIKETSQKFKFQLGDGILVHDKKRDLYLKLL